MSTELLTDEERETISLAGRVYTNIKHMCGESSTRSSDLTEAATHCHALQQMAQAAARAYPDEFRLLGGTHDESICGHVGPYLTDNDTAAVACRLEDGHAGEHAWKDYPAELTWANHG